MPRPISRSQLDKLGRRLAQAERISDEDYEILAGAVDLYQVSLDKVEERLRGLGFQATTRVKTTGTLVDKLRRTHLSLKNIQDVAGARIVLDGGRREQDEAVDRIMEAFRLCPKAPVKVDRRETPSHGYRAVHVIVYEDSRPVEIQVRTKMQDAWAQISEKLGDIWGRGLRYGDGPDQPDQPADPAEPAGPTRSRVVQALLQLGDATSHLEAAQRELDRVTEQLLQLPAERRKEPLEQIERLSAELATLMDNLHDQMGNFLTTVRTLGGRQ